MSDDHGMSDDTSADPAAVGETEALEASPTEASPTEASPTEAVYAWSDETWDEGRPARSPRIDGRVIPAALTALAAAAVSVAATLVLTTPREPDRFTIRPAPVEQAAPPPTTMLIEQPPPPAPRSLAKPSPPAAPAYPAPPAQAAPAPAQAPPPDARGQFTRSLHGDTLATQGGRGLNLTEGPAAVDSEAADLCNSLANGGDVQPYIDGTLKKSPSLTRWQAVLVVNQAIHAYCPQFTR